ncbi:MAG: galactose oxidase [Spirochaetes bacterium]|nr:galactose oxidase [Spirochaetota bacterium]
MKKFFIIFLSLTITLILISIFSSGCDLFTIIESSASNGTGDPHGWMLINGSDQIEGDGIYGTQGAPATGNIPGGREGATTWKDSSGNFWLFGGYGKDKDGLEGNLNDLWKYNPSTNQWAWIKGSNILNQNGIYGTLNTPDPANNPGGRSYGAGILGTSNNLWLFGGYGRDKDGLQGYLNDLWKYDISTNQWSWVSGSDSGDQWTSGTTIPGGKTFTKGWIDSSNNIWIFGGYGYGIEPAGTGNLNDMWKFDGSVWELVKGTTTLYDAGSYGTMNVTDINNIPPARSITCGWKDTSGNFFIFGGYSYDSGDIFFQDLWKFDGANWTWVGGTSGQNASGVYSGTMVPGARFICTCWSDSSGNFWLYGGAGYDGYGTEGKLNDLWRYNGSEWAWISGSDTADEYGVYTVDPVPGGRTGCSGWIDSSNRLWIFGGEGYNSSSLGRLNDLWRYRN